MLFKLNGLKAHKREETGMEYCGIDVHQKYSEICILAEDGEVMERTKVQTTRRALERFFSKKETMKIVLETVPGVRIVQIFAIMCQVPLTFQQLWDTGCMSVLPPDLSLASVRSTS